MRRRLLDVSIGLVEDLRHVPDPSERGRLDFCSVFQVCFPYRGLFVWHVEGDEIIGDPTQTVFVRAGERYRVSGPSWGYGELIVTPDIDALSEIAHLKGQRLGDHPLFRRRTWRADAQLQVFRARFRSWALHTSDMDNLGADEALLALLRAAFATKQAATASARTTQLIQRTKRFLQAEMACPLRLPDVSRAVGASPAYLTDVFRRFEGLSLHRYLTQLRLARALVELPHADDLTALALDVGFSSHSHFTSAFRRAYGCTPSQFRLESRRAARPRYQPESA